MIRIETTLNMYFFTAPKGKWKGKHHCQSFCYTKTHMCALDDDQTGCSNKSLGGCGGVGMGNKLGNWLTSI